MDSRDDAFEKRGRGRPKSKHGGNGDRFEMRLSEDEQTMLEHLVIEEGENKSEHMRKALKMYYAVKSSKW